MQHGSDSAPTRGRPLGKKKFAFPSPLRLPFCSFPAAHLLSGWGSSRSSWLSFRKGQRRAYNPCGSSRGARRLYWSPQQCSAGRYEGGGRQGRRAGAETGVRRASSSKPASERESERARGRAAPAFAPRRNFSHARAPASQMPLAQAPDSAARRPPF